MPYPIMSRTTQCPQCGVVLNLPPAAEGRRLRCPKCSTKFLPDQPGTRPPSSAPGVAEAGPASSQFSTEVRDLIPTAEGDLRETFDLPMMTEAAPTTPRPGRPTSADAAALFRDDEPPMRRRGPAEARSQARRCTSCGGTVAPGTSICSFCGLDVETGLRAGAEIGVEEEFDDDSMPTHGRRPPMPVGIALLGGLCLAGGVIFSVVSLMQWMNNREGFEFLGIVSLFGIFASIQFLRGKSAKLLLVALTLGALVDIVGLIALPVYRANEDEPAATQSIVVGVQDEAEDDADAEPAPTGLTYAERLDFTSIGWGVGLLIGYAFVAFYLSTPQVRRHFSRA